MTNDASRAMAPITTNSRFWLYAAKPEDSVITVMEGITAHGTLTVLNASPWYIVDLPAHGGQSTFMFLSDAIQHIADMLDNTDTTD